MRLTKLILKYLPHLKDVFELMDACQYSINAVSIEITRLIKEGYVQGSDDVLSLTKKGKTLRQTLGISDVIIKNHLDRFEKIIKNAPADSDEFWQDPAQSVDLINHFNVMRKCGDIEGSKILIIGDDDYFCLAIALSGLAKNITVLEIDPKIVNFILEKSDELGFDIDIRQYTVEDPLPIDLIGTFDVYISDGTDTLLGQKLFHSRGLQALVASGIIYFSIGCLDASLMKWHQLQSWLIKNNLVLTDIKRQFTYYPDDSFKARYPLMRMSKAFPFTIGSPKKNWYSSSFYRAERIGPSTDIFIGQKKIGRDLYEDEDIMTFIDKPK